MSKSVRKSGVVTIKAANADVIVGVVELSTAGELNLWNTMKGRAKKALGPATFWANAKAGMDACGDENFKALLASTAASMIVTGGGVHDDAVQDHRSTPAGVALEMFLRSRDSMPEMTEKEFQVLINDANCLEVRVALLEALSDNEKN